jgi:hypothetical protein
MSADTYIYVDPKKHEVWLCTASCVCGHKRHHLQEQKFSQLGTGASLQDAIKIADKYDRKHPLDVEYGYHTKLWCK